MPVSNPTLEKQISLFKTPFDEATLFNIAEVLQSGNVMMGEKVKELEAWFASCHGGLGGIDPEQCVAVNSCSTALELALGCTPAKGYKVLIPGLTHVSTINAIVKNGLIPKITDVDANLMVNEEILEEAWDKQVGGVVIVGFGGRSPNMRRIRDWAYDKSKDVFLWEDCAHSYGSSTFNEGCGHHSDVVCYSMYPTKPLPGIGGGMIVNNLEDNPRIHKRWRELRYYGFVRDEKGGYDVHRLGSNAYMSDVQAAVILSFLKPHRVSDLIRSRRKVAIWYHEVLEEMNLKKKVKPRRHYGDEYDFNDAYHLFPVILDYRYDREALQAHLTKLGIETGVNFKPLHELSLYKDALRAPTPHLDSIGPRLLSLPCHHEMGSEDVVRVCEGIEGFIKKS